MSLVMRPVGLAEAMEFSPWPGRLLGLDQWTKKRRGHREILAEYDEVYERLLAEWTAFFETLPESQRHSGALFRFLCDFRIRSNRRMAENQEIYGQADPRNYLVSVNEQLYLADLDMFEPMHRQLLIEIVRKMREVAPFDGVLEIGCGSGMNLANLKTHLGLETAGCDLSGRAVDFLCRAATDTGLPPRFSRLDFLADDLSPLAPAKRWCLVSFHAFEQAATVSPEWFDRLRQMQCPPVFGIHCEPLQTGGEGEFARLCHRYAEINLYNQDFIEAARSAEKNAVIEIVELKERVIGNSAFNPSSVLVWRFKETS